MNKDYRHEKVNATSPLMVWRDEIRRRVANASRRLHHHRERREAQREIREAICQ